MPPGVGVLTIEFKVNLLSPAAGERLVARGQVVKSGRTIMACTGEVAAERADGAEQTVALIQATMMVVRDREAITDQARSGRGAAAPTHARCVPRRR